MATETGYRHSPIFYNSPYILTDSSPLKFMFLHLLHQLSRILSSPSSQGQNYNGRRFRNNSTREASVLRFLTSTLIRNYSSVSQSLHFHADRAFFAHCSSCTVASIFVFTFSSRAASTSQMDFVEDTGVTGDSSHDCSSCALFDR